MKKLLMALVVGSLVVGVVGCREKTTEEKVKDAAEAVQKDAASTAEDLKKDASKAAEDLKKDAANALDKLKKD